MGLSGDLKDFNITNLIQLNCVEKGTVQVAINWKGREASIFVVQGEIVHARFGDLTGEAALYKILRLDEGEFSITKPIRIPDRTIYVSWKGLLLEGARVMDESEKEKDAIVRNIAVDLGRHSDVNKLLIVTDGGECIQNNGFDLPERYAAIASEFFTRSELLAAPLALGGVTYGGYSTPKHNVFFFKCDHFFIVAELHRETNVEPLLQLVDGLRGKLMVTELQPG